MSETVSSSSAGSYQAALRRFVDLRTEVEATGAVVESSESESESEPELERLGREVEAAGTSTKKSCRRRVSECSG